MATVGIRASPLSLSPTTPPFIVCDLLSKVFSKVISKVVSKEKGGVRGKGAKLPTVAPYGGLTVGSLQKT